MILRISLSQMDIVLGEQEENFSKAGVMIAEAARRGSQLVLLPELWSTGYDLARTAAMAVPPDQGPFAHMAELARKHQIHIFGSCLAAVDPDRKYNAASLFGPEGLELAHYNKIHLFRLMDEHRHLVAGNRPVLVETPWGKAGLAICYDLRFPELFRAYSLAGARLILIVAEWPKPRLQHWQTLLRARAIENQLYVVACNRVGISNGLDFFGHSCVIDTWGEFVVEAGETEMLITVDIDLGKVDEVRSTIPVFADRRAGAYANF